MVTGSLLAEALRGLTQHPMVHLVPPRALSPPKYVQGHRFREEALLQEQPSLLSLAEKSQERESHLALELEW